MDEGWKKYENQELTKGDMVKAGVYSNRLIEVEITAEQPDGKFWAWDDINRLEVLVDKSIISYIRKGGDEYISEHMQALEKRTARKNKRAKEYYKTVVKARRKAMTGKNKEALVNIPVSVNLSQNAF